ncbi:class I SAM-dependent methyltransferase [Zavarzinia compransoris]|uniref:Methylase n=1 Tax=Zavarzinia compransoris TaxID=1264899 RepID=A0A317E7R6_9PROT|nr:class I SAM-dependent methyltransferase [Zavarzinia compransoris]PWR22324.1 methylase [Zavarzinia compransoris]TDP46910.1 SAM-dependent methyltransferase [Zavarzinia compransoris]
MSDWSGGYVTDVEYVTACYPEQAPIHLDLMALLAGVEAPNARGRAQYCELGAGQGLTAILIAATNPEIDVHAIDFMPAQVARAQALADQLEIGNVQFHEASFIDMAEGRGPALPRFHYVTMHGVYSWVSRENQRAIVKFLADRLEPGGLVYTSYNALPGWSEGIPVQRLLFDVGSHRAGNPAERVGAGFDLMEKLLKSGAIHLTSNQLVKELLEVEGRNPTYLAHEYMNQYWKPLFFADVARDFAEAKLEYAGPARPLELFDQFMISDEQQALIARFPDPILAETLRDYCRPRTFRADIHVKGARRMSGAERDARLAAVPLTLCKSPLDFAYQLETPTGVATLAEETYRPLVEALAERGPTTIGELLTDPAYKGRRPTSVTEVVGMLMASRAVSAAVPVEDPALTAHCRQINRYVAHRMAQLQTRSGVPLAAPALRNARHLEQIDVVATYLINQQPGIGDEALAARILAFAAPDDAPPPPAEERDRLRAVVAGRRGIWRYLGLID